MDITVDDVAALLGAKELELYFARKRIAELEAQLTAQADQHTLQRPDEK